MGRETKAEACECCGSYTCSFVREKPGNLALRLEAATQELEYRTGVRKEKPKTADQIGSERAYQDTL